MIALTRDVSPGINACELTHLAREPIDVQRATEQHRRYEELLQELGCEVHRVAAAPELPDGVFVEDTAIVLDEIAVITRPGAESRRAETGAVAAAMAAYRGVVSVIAPGTLDGGDVLRVGRALYVRISARSNVEGASQLARLTGRYGYSVHQVEVTGCLHLKSAVTEVADGTLLHNPAWVDRGAFDGLELIEVDPSEPFGANALRVGSAVVYATAWDRTRRRLERRGIHTTPVDASELAKAEAGVTCCSLIFR
ncbi:MAG: dimethylarginine dimethylaminohydrolase family protein [Gemmatimonadales bacterium]